MSGVIGYVVIQFNQASKMPGLPSAELHDTASDARAEMDGLAEDTARVGRGEWYAVAEVAFTEAD